VDFDAQDFADGGQLKGNHGSLACVKQGQAGYGGDPYLTPNNFPLNANTIGHALTQMPTLNMAAIRTNNQSSERILDKYANDAREREAPAFRDAREREASAFRTQQENNRHQEYQLGQFIQALIDNLGNPTLRSGRISLNPNASNSSILPNPHALDT